MKISLIITGVHTAQPEAKGVFLPGHTGAVTLVQTESKNILVDVGGRGTFDRVKLGLAKHNITPQDIHLIILTHLHLDHSYNLPYFSNARIFAWNHEWREDGTFRFNDIEKAELPKGIKIIKTPGHTPEHLAVLVQQGNQLTAIIGDAFNEDYVETGKVGTFCYDELLYRGSALKILELADYIIPGHGEPFRLQ